MTQPRQPARVTVAMASPAIVAFLFTLLESQAAWGQRLMNASVVAFAVWIFSALGFVVATVAADSLLGPHGDEPFGAGLPRRRDLVAGTLLATGVWMWWHYDRQRVTREIAGCVEQKAEEDRLTPRQLREAVWDCYRNPPSYDDPFQE